LLTNETDGTVNECEQIDRRIVHKNTAYATGMMHLL